MHKDAKSHGFTSKPRIDLPYSNSIVLGGFLVTSHRMRLALFTSLTACVAAATGDNRCHRALAQFPSSRLTITAALAMRMASPPLSAGISRPPLTAVTVTVP